MSIGYRILLYALAMLIGTGLIIVREIMASAASGDPSAFAWVGFLPFFLPLLAIGAAKFVLPVAAAIELAILFSKLKT